MHLDHSYSGCIRMAIVIMLKVVQDWGQTASDHTGTADKQESAFSIKGSSFGIQNGKVLKSHKRLLDDKLI